MFLNTARYHSDAQCITEDGLVLPENVPANICVTKTKLFQRFQDQADEYAAQHDIPTIKGYICVCQNVNCTDTEDTEPDPIPTAEMNVEMTTEDTSGAQKLIYQIMTVILVAIVGITNS